MQGQDRVAGSKFSNEMYGDDGAVREHYRRFARWLADTPPDRLAQKRAEADALFRRSASPSPSTARTPAPSG